MAGAAATSAEIETMSPARRLRNVLGGSAGNLVEWFDWFAYASFSVYFASIFFPKGDQTTQFLQSAAVFSVGFIARPMGAWLMGVYADRHGRRAALTLAVSMMCFGSLLIAVLPGYDTIGVFAPILLAFARIVQGVSVGGEFGASATYVSEMAGKHRRGFWSGFLYVTLIGGQLLAIMLQILLQKVLTPEQLQAWGWRIPFVVGALLAVGVFWLRRNINETTAFVKTEGVQDRGKTMLLFLKYPKATAVVFILSAAGSMSFYAFTTYMQKFLINSAAGPAGNGFSKDQAAQIMTAVLFLFMLMQPLAGWISDRTGRKPIVAWGFALGALAVIPIFNAIHAAGNGFTAALLCMIPLVLLSGYTATSAILKAEFFPAHVRALGVALPYALAQAFFGGTTESVALLFKKSGFETGFFYVLAGAQVLAFVTALIMRDSQKHSLIADD
jgi:MHS family alpha-ketoglutarate permease-like MFS transporter